VLLGFILSFYIALPEGAPRITRLGVEGRKKGREMVLSYKGEGVIGMKEIDVVVAVRSFKARVSPSISKTGTSEFVIGANRPKKETNLLK
jgi:hypothetical protein